MGAVAAKAQYLRHWHYSTVRASDLEKVELYTKFMIRGREREGIETKQSLHLYIIIFAGDA